MNFSRVAKKILREITPLRRLVNERNHLDILVEELRSRCRELEEQLQVVGSSPNLWPPGHYYSPLPALDEVRARERQLFAIPESIPAVELCEESQLDLVQRFRSYYDDQPFAPERQNGLRYYYENEFFSYGDGLMLYSMLRHLRPNRVVEIGSGFSSALILDVNKLFLHGQARCTFIEPHPERLLGLVGREDEESFELIHAPLQDVPLDVFNSLGEGDILFIDSTHVSKVGSDVNTIFFEVLPRLPTGVTVHIHDIFYPFEYPSDWIYGGRAWNEAYVLRAFLSFNWQFEVRLMNSYLKHFHHDAVVDALPLWKRNPGASVWMQRVSPKRL